jgi:hypothetical protein
MKITPEELQRRLNSSGNLLNKINKKSSDATAPNKNTTAPNKKGNDEFNRNNAGRAPNIPNAPEGLRIVAGTLSAAGETATKVAEALNLSPPQVRYAEKSKIPQIKVTEKAVQEIALTRLLDAAGLLDIDRIINEKPKDIASIAANLSRVYSNLRDKNSSSGDNQVVVNIYSPRQKREQDYEVIEVQQTGT